MTAQVQSIIEDVTSCKKCQWKIDTCKGYDGCLTIIKGEKVGLTRFKLGFLERNADAETQEWCIAEERKQWYEEFFGAPTQ